MKKDETIKQRNRLIFRLTVYIFIGMVVSAQLMGGFFWLLSLKYKMTGAGFIIYMAVTLNASAILGTAIAIFMSRTILKDFQSLGNGMRQIAAGNFNVRLDFKKPPAFKKMSDNFNHMALELGSMEIMRGDFINYFSHELKTPLTAISGFAKLLKNDNLPAAEREEYLNTICEEANRLAGLSSNILLLAKLESQSGIIQKNSFMADEQIRRCLILLMPQWEKKQIQMELSGLGPVKINANEELLHHLWINLLGNAVKFTPDKGVISVSARETEDGAEIIISDSGIGIKEENIKYIFDKFYRTNDSGEVYGNGLGLSIVKRIVELSLGSIEVESEFQKGAKFIITLPR